MLYNGTSSWSDCICQGPKCDFSKKKVKREKEKTTDFFFFLKRTNCVFLSLGEQLAVSKRGSQGFLLLGSQVDTSGGFRIPQKRVSET